MHYKMKWILFFAHHLHDSWHLTPVFHLQVRKEDLLEWKLVCQFLLRFFLLPLFMFFELQKA